MQRAGDDDDALLGRRRRPAYKLSVAHRYLRARPTDRPTRRLCQFTAQCPGPVDGSLVILRSRPRVI